MDSPLNLSAAVCILLPVLNEAQNLHELVSRIYAARERRDYLLCFVDDGSSDGTVEIIRQIINTGAGGIRVQLIERVKTGAGSQRGSALFAAMIWALESSGCQIFVEMDGDLSHRPEELEIGLSAIENGKADVVIASKYLRGSQTSGRSLGRRAVSVICNRAVRALISSKVTDYSNGFRFYNREAANLIATTKIRYASPIYLTEVMAMWISQALRICEFPSHYVGRQEGLSKLRWSDLMKSSVAIFEVAFRFHIRGFEKAERAAGLEMARGLTAKTTL